MTDAAFLSLEDAWLDRDIEARGAQSDPDDEPSDEQIHRIEYPDFH